MKGSHKNTCSTDDFPEFFKIFIPELCTHQLRIPPVFLKNFDGDLPQKAILESSSKRSWRVEMKKVNEKMFFQEGWQEFVQDHSLKFGDVVIFSYAAKSKFYVEIYGRNCSKKQVSLNRSGDKSLALIKENQATEPSVSKIAIEENNGAVQAANKSISIYPSFRRALGSAYVSRGFLCIPVRFHKRYMRAKRPSATLQLSGKSWAVKLSDSCRPCFSNGWRRFVEDNNLQAGDVCSFELIGRTNNVLKVSISRSQANVEVSVLRINKERERKIVEHKDRPRKIFLFGDHPEFFKVYIPDQSSEKLCIPPAFIEHFNGSVPDTSSLQDLGGKYWHVKMEEAENGVFIKSGWQHFVSDHTLKFGDFLFFRYNGTSSFTVRIFGTNGCKREEPLVIENIVKKIEEGTEEGCSKRSCTGKRKYSKQEIEDKQQTYPKRSRISKQKCSRIEIKEEKTCLACSPNGKRKCSKLSLKRSMRSRGAPEVCPLKSPSFASKNIENLSGFEATGFVPPKNPHFIAALTRSRRYYMYIPKQLLSQLLIDRFGEMVLSNQNGKKWALKLHFTGDGRAYFSHGWLNFWKENRLCFDDLCLFEFVHVKGKLCKEIQVQISRVG